MADDRWAVGVDLGGTKMEIAAVDAEGRAREPVRRKTRVEEGAEAVFGDLEAGVREVLRKVGSRPVGVGVGVAGQVEAGSGVVRFAPNLRWQDVRLGERLRSHFDFPVTVTNDVRAATWGEWLHGAGRGCGDVVCIFVGTGIGGGVVSGGHVLTGHTNAAGELGHMTVRLRGPRCRCGNRGCLEALAGGWAIARRAKRAISAAPSAGGSLLRLAGGNREEVTAETVSEAFRAGDPLAAKIVDVVAEALAGGAVGLVNAFNPCRLILGGGVVEGLPVLVKRVEEGVRIAALRTARERLQVVRAELGRNAGVVGAAALALRPEGTQL